ncbi:nicotinate-nucleotide adenylyltransferase [Xylanibacillus composti]|uniref:Probable nicotinate-nucleotide adenylyltransferase n=1 Tax=Xylanibacillus composti TaxID=1572762 RepID=A0A8J4M2D1_9BACL|nr:nicotinate-nucleotide adenylyltransferase [Xylanibacillus composti]MDT9724473.1 nicotinate-nucleotide adenylyltransferase [Xylanibacillus composti]GIQ69735.1 putative nicotinate-nucleotide adenylyltransferase [Xylanibacillus composti]
MRIGILGGSFDPVHLGHLIAAERAREELRLDEVWLMPAFVPPHKRQAGDAAPAADRLAMLERAIAPYAGIRVTDIEIKRGGISYTADTMKTLTELYPEHQFSFIIGADMVQILPAWQRINELIRYVRFAALDRPGFPAVSQIALPKDLASQIDWVEMPAIDLSSTYVRSLCKKGRSVRFLVPDSVYDYIKERRLYEA